MDHWITGSRWITGSLDGVPESRWITVAHLAHMYFLIIHRAEHLSNNLRTPLLCFRWTVLPSLLYVVIQVARSKPILHKFAPGHPLLFQERARTPCESIQLKITKTTKKTKKKEA